MQREYNVQSKSHYSSSQCNQVLFQLTQVHHCKP